MVIYLDMDGVLVDLLGTWMPELNRRYGVDYTPDDMESWYLEDLYGKDFNELETPCHQVGFWANLEPYPGAYAFVYNLKKMGHTIYLASKPFPSEDSYYGKVQWVKKNLPFLPSESLILIHDKYRLRGDVLVDDHPKNLTRFSGKRILMDRPGNRILEEGLLEHWFERAFSYSQILEMLGQEY